MTKIKDTIKQLRLKNGLTQGELAKKIGISKSSIGMYETGKREPDMETLKRFAQFFDTDMNYLINGTTDTVISLMNKYPNIYPLTLKKLPLLGSISCGKPVFANEEKGNFVEVGSGTNADFCLKASGDSMIDARINDGDLVYIKSQPIVENGEIAAVIIGEEALLKRVYLYPDKIVLNPANPKYEPLVFLNEEMNNVHILGKAVAFQSVIR